MLLREGIFRAERRDVSAVASYLCWVSWSIEAPDSYRFPSGCRGPARRR
jgi:hypothetical protein